MSPVLSGKRREIKLLRCTDDGASVGPGSLIANDDEVIVYMRQDEMKLVDVDAAKTFNCRYGSYNMRVGIP